MGPRRLTTDREGRTRRVPRQKGRFFSSGHGQTAKGRGQGREPRFCKGLSCPRILRHWASGRRHWLPGISCFVPPLPLHHPCRPTGHEPPRPPAMPAKPRAPAALAQPAAGNMGPPPLQRACWISSWPNPAISTKPPHSQIPPAGRRRPPSLCADRGTRPFANGEPRGNSGRLFGADVFFTVPLNAAIHGSRTRNRPAAFVDLA